MEETTKFLTIAEHLEMAGLIWQPEIGDEVSNREKKELISILIDPNSLPLKELRASYLWLPNVDQLVKQFEIRQSILLHAGLEVTENRFCYKSIVQAQDINIEAEGLSLRSCLGNALRDLLVWKSRGPQVH